MPIEKMNIIESSISKICIAICICLCFIGECIANDSIRIGGKANIRVGEPLELTVTMDNPAWKVDLSNAPSGMVLKGSKILWTPRTEDIGWHPVELTVDKGEAKVKVSHRVTVINPSWKLDMEIRGLSIDLSGENLVAWSESNAENEGTPTPLNVELSSEMAILNLKQGTVSRHRMKGKILRVLLGENFVVPIVRRGEDVLAFFLKRQTFEVRKVIATEEVWDLRSGFLVNENGRIYVMDKATLAPTTISGQPELFVRKCKETNSQGFLIDGIDFDVDGKIARLASLPKGWPLSFEKSPLDFSEVDPPNPKMYPKMHISRSDPLNLSSGDGMRMRIGFRKAPISGGNPTDPDFYLVGIGNEFVIIATDLPEIAPLPNGQIDIPRIVYENWIYVAIKNEIFGVDISGLNCWKKRTDQLTLQQKQSHVSIASASGQTVLTHQLAFPGKEVSYQLLTQHPGVTLDPTNGTVTLDNSSLTKEAHLQVVKYLVGNARDDSLSNLLRRILVYSQDWCQIAIGKKLTGFPVALPISIQAVRGEETGPVLRYFVIIEVPYNDILRQLAEAGNPASEMLRLERIEKRLKKMRN